MSETLLSQRVTAPGALTPSSIAGAAWRPASHADIDAIAELMQVCSRADHPWYLITREEIENDFASSFIDPERDTLVGVDRAGTLVAYGAAVLLPGREGRARVLLSGGVHPERRGGGLGRALLDWQEGRGLQQLATCELPIEGWLMAYAEETALDAVRLFEHCGFDAARYYSELTRSLAEPIVPVDAVDGIRIRSFDLERDAEAVRHARNDAFRDHWGSQESTEETWSKFMRRSTLRPDLSFLAVDAEGAIAGFVMVTVDPADWQGRGSSFAYVDLVGVPRAFRGRRIARALLSRALQAHAAEGLEVTVLDVDSENPTGAVALYTGVGFTALRRSVMFGKVF